MKKKERSSGQLCQAGIASSDRKGVASLSRWQKELEVWGSVSNPNIPVCLDFNSQGATLSRQVF